MKAKGSYLAIVAAPAATLFFVAQLTNCGGDDNNGGPGAPDASEASTVDSTANNNDTGAPPEVDAEAGTTHPEMDADAAVTAPDGDAGTMTPDAGGEAGITCSVPIPSEGSFISTLAATVCQSLKACCGTGARFDTPTCLSVYGNPSFGAWMGVGFVDPYLDGGRIAYDPAAACQCLEGNATISCGLVQQTTWNSIQQSCLNAVHGTVTVGSASDAGDAAVGKCASSYECASGGFCTIENPSDQDASLGTCHALIGDGGMCASDFQCSYLTNGNPALSCNGQTQLCTPRKGAGAACQNNVDCTLNNCTGGTCQSGILFSDQVGSGGICDALTLPDGG